MQKQILTLGFICLFLNVFSQKKMIELDKRPLHLESPTFYIQKVIDARINHENIGFIQTGIFNKKEDADLLGGVKNTFEYYLKHELPPADEKQPVILKVTHLQISEHTGMTEETGRAELVVEFYIEHEYGMAMVYKTKSSIEEGGFDVTAGHGKRIQLALAKCIADYADLNHQKNLPPTQFSDQFDYSPPQPQVTQKKAKTAFERPRYTNLLMGGPSISSKIKGFGLTYYRYLPGEINQWVFPWAINVEVFTLDEEFFRQFDYHKIAMNYWKFGICPLKQLNNVVYFTMCFMVPVGSEVLTDFRGNETTNFLIGLDASQGFMIIPKSTFGLTVGISIFERVLTSEVYKGDLGIKASIGLKF